MAFLAVNATACPPPTRFGPARDPLPPPAPVAAAPESLAPQPTAQWTRHVGRAVRGSPAIGREVIAVGTVDHALVLLERATGTVLWRTRLSGTIRGGPPPRDHRLYVAAEPTPASHVDVHNLPDRRPAQYRFSIDFTGTDLADDPEQHKHLHVCALEGGLICALPNNRILFRDDAFWQVMD